MKPWHLCSAYEYFPQQIRFYYNAVERSYPMETFECVTEATQWVIAQQPGAVWNKLRCTAGQDWQMTDWCVRCWFNSSPLRGNQPHSYSIHWPKLVTAVEFINLDKPHLPFIIPPPIDKCMGVCFRVHNITLCKYTRSNSLHGTCGSTEDYNLKKLCILLPRSYCYQQCVWASLLEMEQFATCASVVVPPTRMPGVHKKMHEYTRMYAK